MSLPKPQCVTIPDGSVLVRGEDFDSLCKYREWYEAIAPRLTNFGNDLPDGIVPRGVDVLHALRNWVRDNASAPRKKLLGFSADDVSCFLMCVDEFWHRHNAWDISKRISETVSEERK
jgi:hypothetical protein